MKPLNSNKPATIDPVCGQKIDPDSKSKFFTSVNAHSYYFCTEKCRDEFNQDPTRYINTLSSYKNRKNWWGRYLDRVQKATIGKPPKCCQ